MHGEVGIGRYGPVRCAASACDEDSQLAVLIKRDNETIDDLFERQTARLQLFTESASKKFSRVILMVGNT